MATFLEIQTRFLYLIDESTISATHKSHINYAVKDITNAFPFSWNVKTNTVTLSSGAGNLPTDFNPKWGLLDARIVNSDTADDDIFEQIPIADRDSYDDDDYKYWITYDTSTSRYILNSSHQSGTVTIYYHFIPTDMSTDPDVCVVFDGEAVAYLGASKNWVGDERNVGLKNEYEKEAASRVQQMYTQDLNFSEKTYEYSKLRDQDISVAGG